MLLLLCALSALAAPIRVDLVPFGRVVRYAGDSPETFEAHTLERGRDGWQACKGADGEYMIGLMWDEPRDMAEVGLDFRDVFPGRDQIRVQYFFKNWPNLDVGGWAPIDDPFHGQWKTIPLQNAWLGERAVTLPFASLNTEPQRETWHGERYRRTYHIRLLFGTNAPPPVTALHAYGLQPAIEAEFELRLERGSTIRPPLEVSVVNGELLNARGEAVRSLRLDVTAWKAAGPVSSRGCSYAHPDGRHGARRGEPAERFFLSAAGGPEPRRHHYTLIESHGELHRRQPRRQRGAGAGHVRHRPCRARAGANVRARPPRDSGTA